jgi:heat-inducible transcriptional repressor
MGELTERQKEILAAIIKEYMASAQEVGSQLLLEKYKMRISSATIRNEMMHLMEMGLLRKSHISSGRLPTDQALRIYFREMVVEPVLDPLEEIAVKQSIFRNRFDKERLARTILEVLSDATSSATFLLTHDSIRYHGVSSLMRYTELQHIKVIQRVLDLLEDEELLQQVIRKYLNGDTVLLIGEESGIEDMEDVTMAVGTLPDWDENGAYYGVIGSKRVDYSHALSVMRKVKESVEESLRGWR